MTTIRGMAAVLALGALAACANDPAPGAGGDDMAVFDPVDGPAFADGAADMQTQGAVAAPMSAPMTGDPNLSALMGGSGAPGVGLSDGGRAPIFIESTTQTAAAPAGATDGMNDWLDGVAPESAGAAPAAAPSNAATAPAGSFGVQIASYKQREAAERGWTLLSQRYDGLLDRYSNRIIAAEIPGRGQFFRLVAVGGERQAMTGLCDQIMARGGSCLLRRL